MKKRKKTARRLSGLWRLMLGILALQVLWYLAADAFPDWQGWQDGWAAPYLRGECLWVEELFAGMMQSVREDQEWLARTERFLQELPAVGVLFRNPALVPIGIVAGEPMVTALHRPACRLYDRFIRQKRADVRLDLLRRENAPDFEASGGIRVRQLLSGDRSRDRVQNWDPDGKIEVRISLEDYGQQDQVVSFSRKDGQCLLHTRGGTISMKPSDTYLVKYNLPNSGVTPIAAFTWLGK